VEERDLDKEMKITNLWLALAIYFLHKKNTKKKSSILV
jgi:hypothetical protein